MDVKNIKCLEGTIRFLESVKDESGKKKYPVIIISQGLGNLVDKNYYTKEAILSGVAVYEGKKAYIDHPTPYEQTQRPLRSVNETVGHYENCRAEMDADGMMVLKADFIPEAGTGIEDKLDHAIDFKKKYPDKDYIGISINGDGEGQTMDYGEFLRNYSPTALEMEKISKINGEPINVITKLTDAISADLVTSAGAKGRILTEMNKKIKTRRQVMLEAIRKLFKGIETKDSKVTEEAVKSMMEEETPATEVKPVIALESMQAEGLAKHLMACKKEMVKQETDTEEGYEVKCMQAAMEKMAKEAAPAPEVKDEKPADPADPAQHPDAAQDIALIKKMKNESEQLITENEKLKAEKAALEESEKKVTEEAAKAKIELATKKRSDFIDKALAESGLPRSVTKEIRVVVEKCKTEAEITETVKRLAEASFKAIEESFYVQASKGFPEMSHGESTNNDHLF